MRGAIGIRITRWETLVIGIIGGRRTVCSKGVVIYSLIVRERGSLICSKCRTRLVNFFYYF